MSLTIVKTVGLVTVQDLGRRGHMHEAIPPGGGLVPELLVASNRAARNADGLAGVEILGQLVVRADAAITIAIDGAARELRAGDEVSVASGARRCAYLAVRGGVDAPRVLGGHGTLLCAELGRPLRAGDVLRANPAASFTAPVTVPFSDTDPIVPFTAPLAAPFTAPVTVPFSDTDPIVPFTAPLTVPFSDTDPIVPFSDPIAIVPGPDRDAFAPDALDQLVAAPYRVLATSDRVGTRLAGAAIERAAGYRERSRPMVIGALEVPSDGQPIVLGPEHPTTGGYPVLAVIATGDLGRFFLIPLGGSVTFVWSVNAASVVHETTLSGIGASLGSD